MPHILRLENIMERLDGWPLEPGIWLPFAEQAPPDDLFRDVIVTLLQLNAKVVVVHQTVPVLFDAQLGEHAFT